MPFHFLEEVATADIAFEAWGENLEETFISAADATMNVIIEELNSIQPRERWVVILDIRLWITRLRLIARYRFGENVSGYSIGLGISF